MLAANVPQFIAVRLASFVVVLAGMLLCSAAVPATVQTDRGPIEGVEADGVRVFKGIPFAAPPVGALRWHAPELPAAWSGVRKADRASPICPQRGAYPVDSPPEPMSEDCLYLNVWVPAGARDGPLAVMVWIHGGGLRNGSASTPLYAGNALAMRDVIVVTANYRLGALGFLAHPELTSESAQKVSGNYGLLDQIAALGWVQRNIAAFGGDPGNVTVFGQSSGSISISALIASPLARGLFRRAIGQSGGLFEPLEAAPEFKLEGAEKAGLAFAAGLGALSLEKLRELPATEIVARPFHPQPIIDGHLLHETPYETFARGSQNRVDILVGSNEAEGLDFIAGRKIGSANLSAELNEDFPPVIVSLIGPAATRDDKAARAAFIAFESDMRFGWNMWAWARLQAGSRFGKSYLYRFAYVRPREEGATHGAEMPYVFGHLELEPVERTEKDRQLARTLGAYWTNFAKTGDPNGEGLPRWPAFTPSGEGMLLIGDQIRAGVVPNEPGLVAIDRLYAAVRLVTRHGYAIAGAVALALLALSWRLVAGIVRRRNARA